MTWDLEPGYLNTASFGIPPRAAYDAIQVALEDWRRGRTSWEHWGDTTDAARATFARLVGVAAEEVAVAGAVSEFVGLLAHSLPDGARVVAPEIEFTSNLFPYLVHADRGVEVVTVPLEKLVEAIDERTTAVAFSLVQSSTGALAPLDEITAAAAANGALTLCDATQAVGWLPVAASRVDALVCNAYKWLMSPRGTTFLAIRPSLLEKVTPLAANWFAGEDMHSSYYGPPLRLAKDARRLDTSPAWFSWVGTAAALDVVENITVEAIHTHDIALANRFRAGLGLPPGDSAIVTTDWPEAGKRLDAVGIRAAIREGGLRVSFHIYNTEADVDDALAALTD